MKKEKAIKTFWNAVPEGTSIEDLLNGIKVVLPGGYGLHTKPSKKCMSENLEYYQDYLEKLAADILRSEK